MPSRVSVREDQTLLVNGEPFFPVGLYYAQDEMSDASGAGLRKLRAMGFNVVFFNGEVENEELLDRVWEAGLRVCYRPPGGLYREFHLLKEVVSRLARHPALLFWEVDDEPVLNGLRLEDVEIGCRIVRAVDPFHPILCNQWLASLDQAEEMREWARLADVYSFSTYPVPLWRWKGRMRLVEQGWPHAISVVGRQTDLWKSYAAGKPVIPALQAWAWDCLEDGEAAYPTYGECRFMAYQAVINGAKGLHHYGAVEASRANFACGIPPRVREDLEQTYADFLRAQDFNRRFWGYYAQVIKELSLMSGVFASHDADWAPEVSQGALRQPGDKRMECRVKRHRGSAVILLVNASDSRACVELRAPRMGNRELRVWGQGRSLVASSGGIFRDTLGPYGVRIYSDRPDLLEPLSDYITEGG
ncbi:MAG: hypothetical protein LC746_13325 [Acidobacteria bacterium]|nr:hypothetical protein [Acidobacteriota bacterium]